jgi:hypothetical protein
MTSALNSHRHDTPPPAATAYQKFVLRLLSKTTAAGFTSSNRISVRDPHRHRLHHAYPDKKTKHIQRPRGTCASQALHELATSALSNQPIQRTTHSPR